MAAACYPRRFFAFACRGESPVLFRPGIDELAARIGKRSGRLRQHYH